MNIPKSCESSTTNNYLITIFFSLNCFIKLIIFVKGVSGETVRMESLIASATKSIAIFYESYINGVANNCYITDSYIFDAKAI